MTFEYWWGLLEPSFFAYVILLGWKLLEKKKSIVTVPWAGWELESSRDGPVFRGRTTQVQPF
jgi:hypothetical protein